MFSRSFFTPTTGSVFKRIARFYSVQPEGIPLDPGAPASIPVSGQERKVSAQVENLVDQIANLPLLEVSDLNYALKKRLNISDMPFMPAGFALPMAGGAAASSASSETKKSNESNETIKISFSVKLVGFDDTKKIALIKHIRDLVPGLNLVQAKRFVEGIPIEVKNDLGKTEAEEMKKGIESVGGKVEIV